MFAEPNRGTGTLPVRPASVSLTAFTPVKTGQAGKPDRPTGKMPVPLFNPSKSNNLSNYTTRTSIWRHPWRALIVGPRPC
jgi:hypothetical protein